MRDHPSSTFLAWQKAERLAIRAECALFARLCRDGGGAMPSREDVLDLAVLRENAATLMKRLLDEMRELAASLKRS